MSIFASQFDRARVYTGMYTGRPEDGTWRTPRGAATGGGLLAGGVVAALAAGGVATGVAAAAVIEAYFDGGADGGAQAHDGPHDVSHADVSHAAAHGDGVQSVTGHDAAGGGGAEHGHADAWSASWGDGWDTGWDAESSHQLATGSHAETAAGDHATTHLGDASGQAAHQLFAETTGADAGHGGAGKSETDVLRAHDDAGHQHEATGDGGGSGDGVFGHDGAGYDVHDAGYDHAGYDDHLQTGHEDAWAHDAGGHAAGFGGDDAATFHDSGT